MEHLFLIGYIVISLAAAGITLLLAVLCCLKKTRESEYLGITAVFATLVNLAYLASILPVDYTMVSAASSFYFICIDWMLLYFTAFTFYFTHYELTPMLRALFRGGKIYAAIETVGFIVNIYHEFAVSYIPRSTAFACYTYDRMPVYNLHLIFTYSMVVIVALLLVTKALRAPRLYRGQYAYALLGLVIVVICNGMFLFTEGDYFYSQVDYSILGYCVILALTYWAAFEYASHDMLKGLSMLIFDEIHQGIVLFGYDGRLVMSNRLAEKFLEIRGIGRDFDSRSFCEYYHISGDPEADTWSLQCYIDQGDRKQPLRCDYRCLRDAHDRIIGRLYVFTDVALSSDLTTGFYSWDYFGRLVRIDASLYRPPMGVLMMDINNLAVYNSRFGREAGDRLIHELSQAMRRILPEETNFVRGHEANLIALCYRTDEKQMKDYAGQILRDFDGDVQYAMSETAEGDPDILAAISRAEQSLYQKKMLNQKSGHSQVLSSLVRALRESDTDTEAHVQRTQRLGAMLGERIGLTDAQQSQLSLLCLLHDIGKIGIPLEILNKPGKLSREEWEVLKTHVRKGYEIAMSAHELQDIAEMILHHHERWDGKGYPDGLSRETIPLLSRIISVVDAYDAMVTNRIYSRALSREEALGELKACAGSQFDPYIVSEFLRMLQTAGEEIGEFAGEAPLTPPGLAMDFAPETEPEQMGASHPIRYSHYLLNEEGRILEADDQFEKMTGYSAEDIEQLQLTQQDLIPEKDRSEYNLLVSAQLAARSAAFIEHRIRRKDGSALYVFCYGKVYYDAAIKGHRTEIVIMDSTDTYAMQNLLREQQDKAARRLREWENTYRKDSLTGLLGHVAFRSDVEEKLLTGEYTIMMLMLDVDKFKDYNDSYGHSAGDELLILLARTLEAALRKADLPCRMGGDEFAAALFFRKGCSDELMHRRAHEIFEQIHRTLQTSEHPTGISMGAAIQTDEIDTFAALYAASDEALYTSKEAGRSCLSFYGE